MKKEMNEMTVKDFIGMVNEASATVTSGVNRDNDVIINLSDVETLIARLMLKQVNKLYERYTWIDKYHLESNDFKPCLNFVLSELYFMALDVDADASFYDIIVETCIDRNGKRKHKSVILSLMHKYETINFPRHQVRDRKTGILTDSYTCELTEDIEMRIPSSKYAAPENTTIAKVMKETYSFYDDRLDNIYRNADSMTVSIMLDYKDGKTLDEIGKAFGISNQSISKRLRAAKKYL